MEDRRRTSTTPWSSACVPCYELYCSMQDRRRISTTPWSSAMCPILWTLLSYAGQEEDIHNSLKLYHVSHVMNFTGLCRAGGGHPQLPEALPAVWGPEPLPGRPRGEAEAVHEDWPSQVQHPTDGAHVCTQVKGEMWSKNRERRKKHRKGNKI